MSSTPQRSEALLDSGGPRSDLQQRYDVVHYELRHDIDVENRSIAGSATVEFQANRAMDALELDFDGAYAISRIRDGQTDLEYSRTSETLTIHLATSIEAGDSGTVTVYYSGRPHEAEQPPWQGGFTWEETPSGKPWIATSLHGEGCDLWWPCKDHPASEALSLDLYFTVDAGLTATSNGVLVGVEEHDNGRRTFHWRATSQTNNYGVALNIAPYVLFEDTYTSTNGTEVPIMFWAIEDHADEARDLFERELVTVAQWFERTVGPYPWGHEKLGVTETPYLGMEHQTINAYGNEFQHDKYGFDWLLHHELAHEWFGNVMTNLTWSHMWLHEGFGAYAQPLYTRDLIGDAAFHARMYEIYLSISACNPLAPRGELTVDEVYFVDDDGEGPGGDIYAKGAWVAHSLRYLMGDDAFWRSVRMLVYDTPDPASLPAPIQAIHRTTDDYLRIASEVHGESLDWFFEVYTRRGPLPDLAASQQGDDVLLTWSAPDDLEFPMPIPVRIGKDLRRVEFTGNQALLEDTDLPEIFIDPYMAVLRKLPILETCAEKRARDSVD